MSDGDLSGREKARLQSEKEDQAWRDRLAGASPATVARAYGCGLSTVYRWFKNAAYRHVSSDIEEQKALDLARLDVLLAGLWPKAITGAGFSVDRVLAIMERRAKLLGMDAPTTINVRHELAKFTKEQALAAGLSEAEALAIVDEVLRDARATG